MSEQRMIGDILYERRKRLGLSLDRVVSDTKLQRRLVEAFERSDFEAMPPRGHAQATLATYARYLDLDDAELLRLYESQRYHHERELRAAAQPQRPRGVDAPERPSRPARRSTGLYDDGYGSQRRERRGEDRYEERPRTSRRAYEDGPSQDRPARERREDAPRRGSGGYGGRPSTDRRGTGVVTLDDGYQGGSGGGRAYAPAPGSLGRERAGSGARGSDQLREALSGAASGIATYLRENRTASFILVAVVALLIVVLLIFAITSCVSRAGSGGADGTIPVSTIGTSGTQDGAQTGGGAADASANGAATTTGTAATQTFVTPQTATIDLTNLAHGSIVSFMVSQMATESPWIEVTADNVRQYAQNASPGTTQSYTIGYGITITTNKPELVSFMVNGTQVQPTVADGTGTLTCSVAADQQGPLVAAAANEPAAADAGATDAGGDGAADVSEEPVAADPESLPEYGTAENRYDQGTVEVHIDADGTPYYYGVNGYEEYAWKDGTPVTA